MSFLLVDEQHRYSRNRRRRPPVCTECREDDHSGHPLFGDGTCAELACQCVWRPSLFHWGPVVRVYCGCSFRAVNDAHHLAEYCSHTHRESLQLRHAWRPLTLPDPILATFIDVRGVATRCSTLTKRIAPPPSHPKDVLVYVGLVTNQFLRAGHASVSFQDSCPAEVMFLDATRRRLLMSWHTE